MEVGRVGFVFRGLSLAPLSAIDFRRFFRVYRFHATGHVCRSESTSGQMPRRVVSEVSLRTDPDSTPTFELDTRESRTAERRRVYYLSSTPCYNPFWLLIPIIR